MAKDYDQDPERLDGEYTTEDQALIRSWAPNSTIIFQEVNMYSSDALEPETDAELIRKWIEEGFDGSVKGRSLSNWQSKSSAAVFLFSLTIESLATTRTIDNPVSHA